MELNRRLDALTELYLALTSEQRLDFLDRVAAIDRAQARIEALDRDLTQAVQRARRPRPCFAHVPWNAGTRCDEEPA